MPKNTNPLLTDDRISKNGLYTIDKRQIELWGETYTAESVINELFYSRFATVGVPIPEKQSVIYPKESDISGR